jgi:hypothetical protein
MVGILDIIIPHELAIAEILINLVKVMFGTTRSVTPLYDICPSGINIYIIHVYKLYIYILVNINALISNCYFTMC